MTPSPAPAPTEGDDPQTIAAAFARAQELWLNDSGCRTLDQHEDEQLQALLHRREAQARRDGAEVEREACAQIHDAQVEHYRSLMKSAASNDDEYGASGYEYAMREHQNYAKAIRARSNPSGDRT